MKTKLLTGLMMLLGSASLAFAQGALGTPMPRENAYDPAFDRSAVPRLVHSTRCRFTPIRSAFSHLFPAPVMMMDTTPTRADITRMIEDGYHSPAEVTAARIKIDEAQSNARRAAVKYLASVDCHYYPEAEAGLIGALRADRSEGVRYEAALALGQGRALSPLMLSALNIAATGMDTDGNPAETSERVRVAARQALERSAAAAWSQMYPHSPLAFDGYPHYPMFVQPAGYAVPMYPYVDPSLARERQVAETVSTRVRPAEPAKAQRSLLDFLTGWLPGREAPPRDPAAMQRMIEARMQGIRPLGSHAVLAIPVMPSFPYNSQD